ncbi:MAG: hypothetical protein KKC28_14870 [Verrucomicrobia bacterium]|nr:hypothetical protein [Verrucomicrobiota bacterium]
MTAKEHLWVVNAIPGRVRLRFRADKKEDPDLDKLLKIKGIEELAFNSITKSLIIIYREKVIVKEKLLKEIEKALPGTKICFHSEKENVKPEETAMSIEGNMLSHNMYALLRKMNKSTHRGLKGYADLTSMLPAILFLWGIEELIRNPVMPKWYDILRSAESMLFNFRGPHSVPAQD